MIKVIKEFDIKDFENKVNNVAKNKIMDIKITEDFDSNSIPPQKRICYIAVVECDEPVANAAIDPTRKKRTVAECVESLECLFKSYSKDSEFNYQLSVSDSPWNILRNHIEIFDIIKKKRVNLDYLRSCKTLEDYNNILIEKWQLTEFEFNLIKEWLER